MHEHPHLKRERQVFSTAILKDFSSNDYLNLRHHAAIKKAYRHGIEKYGLGSGASPLVSGYTKAHQALEAACAEFLQREKAVLFNSGYHANLGLLTTLGQCNTTIFADKFVHASIIDGIRLSDAEYYRYQHQNLLHLKILLEKKARTQNILVTESVFSMEGTLTALPELINSTKHYPLHFIIDDAHAMGILGKNGAGSCEHFNIAKDAIDYLITPLGKAFASFGAIVSGKASYMENLIQHARTYKYSTALPPALCIGTLAALDIIKKESWRRDKLKTLSNFFHKQAQTYGFNLTAHEDIPIKTILLGSNVKASLMQKKLLARRILVAVIRPPTVPMNTARLRISLNATHTENDITFLLHSIKDLQNEIDQTLF